jgi:glucose/arabinose dehydrogenase
MYRSQLQALESRTLLAITPVPSGFVAELVTGGLANGTALDFAPDGRVFVTQQTGALRVIKDGALLPTPFVTLTVDSRDERGLLGVTFDPNYATNHYVYVYHTVPGTPSVPVHNRVTRFTADAANPDVAVPDSATTIIDLSSLLTNATQHNGGAIHFGLDGKLYVATGENGNGANSQTLDNYLGKMLRLNPDGTAPADNPFFTDDGVKQPRDYIYALGLRNPYTFAIDPADGTMYINDVGAAAWEEINVGRPGANYGWPTVEGPETVPNPAFDDPLFAYGRSGDVNGNVISGGAFYRRPANATSPFPSAYEGDYFFGDAARGWVRNLDDNTANTFAFLNGAAFAVDMKFGPDGALYLLERGGGGALQRVRFTAPGPTNYDLVAASDTGVSDTDNVTRINTPTFTGNAQAGAVVQLFVDGVNVGQATADNAGAFSITPSAAIAEGVHTAHVVAAATGASSSSITLTIDRTAPTVAASFHYQTGHQIRLQFGEDVRATLVASDLTLSPAHALVMSTTAGPTLATFTPTGPTGVQLSLPDGDYRATLAADAVTDLAGNPLATPVALDFFVYAGDANHDRKVDFADLVVLAQNYNTTGGKTFPEGDFNYDGNVNFVDLVILAQRYNQTLPPPPALAAAPAPITSKVDSPVPNKSLFSATPVVKPVVAKPKPVSRPARR